MNTRLSLTIDVTRG